MATLSEVVKGIQETNELLTENVKGQNRTAAMITAFVTGQQSSFGDRLETAKEKAKRATVVKAAAAKGGGFKSGLMEGSGLAGLLKGGAGLIAFGGSIITALLGGVAGTALLASITRLAGVAFGKILKGALLIGLISKFGEGIIERLFKTLDPNSVVLDDDTKKTFAKNITKALIVGVAVGMFGKTLGLAAFLATLVVESFKSGLSPDMRASLEKDILAGAGEQFGITFSRANLLTIGTFIAGLLTFKLVKGALSAALLGKVVPGAAAGSSKFAKLFRIGFMARFAAATIITSLSETLANAVTNATKSVFLGEGVEFAANGAALALMLGLGPGGILAAALVGLAYAGIKALGRWLTGKREKFADELVDSTNEMTEDFLGKDAAEQQALLTERGLAGFSQTLYNKTGTLVTGGVKRSPEFLESQGNALEILKNSGIKRISDGAKEKLLHLKAEKGTLTINDVLANLMGRTSFSSRASAETAMLRLDELTKSTADQFAIDAKDLLLKNNVQIFDSLTRALNAGKLQEGTVSPRVNETNNITTILAGGQAIRTIDGSGYNQFNNMIDTYAPSGIAFGRGPQ
jgi:hypothetical protein